MAWEVLLEGEKIACYDTRPKMNKEKFILYPELIYRRYKNNTLINEAVLKIVMRAYYPEEFEELITAFGYKIIDQWGGYQGETYGQGPELVVKFEDGANWRKH